jgi:cardiolipin synthase
MANAEAHETGGQAMGEEPSDRIFTVPNLISVIRLLLVPVFGWLVLGGHDMAAVLVLAVSGASDWLDGKLARVLHQTSRLGAALDPAADRLFILVTIFGLAWRGSIPWWLVAAIVAREAVMGVVLLVLRRRGFGVLPVNFVGKAATLGLLYAFPLILLGSLHGVVGRVAWTVGWAFAIWGVALYWLACGLYIRQARQLLACSQKT